MTERRDDDGHTYALVPTGPDAESLPSPSTSSRRRHHSRGVLSTLRAKFLSLRPIPRLLIILAGSLIGVYWLLWLFGDTVSWRLRSHSSEASSSVPDEDLEIRPPKSGPTIPDRPKYEPVVVDEGDQPDWAARALQVKHAFLHAYNGYMKYAFPWDELLPLNNKRVNNYLGGLLSAHSMTKDPILLRKADELGAALLPAFNTTSGYPKFSVRPSDGTAMAYWGKNLVILAEMGSCQMEYKYLAHLTGKREYFEKVEHIREMMEKHQDADKHLLPVFFNFDDGTPASTHFSIGALADSAYEYLLKQYLLTAKQERKALDLYLSMTKGIIENLLYISPKRQLLFATDIERGVPSYIYEHLSCFLPGLFALGAHTLDLPPAEKQTHLWIAEGLATTCWLSYADQTTGLGPEEMLFTTSSPKWYPEYTKWQNANKATRSALPPGVHTNPPPVKEFLQREYTNRRDAYLLRPEVCVLGTALNPVVLITPSPQ
ncbi:hypothetical protein FRB99_007932 [Tulasnella sp. 403]|nr:hypothetical protein FRB99_007932 [Tulasnella sp. 403]